MKGLGRIRTGTMAATVMVAALARGGAQTIPVLRSETRVVEIDVSAKDSRGHAIGDLEQTDFTVTDARKPRAIQIFSVDRGERREAPAEPPHALPPDVFSNRVASIPPPGRTTVILLDAANTYFDDYARSRQQVLDLLDKLPRDERVALYVLYGGLQILGDFTTDRESLRQAILHYPTPPITARPTALQRGPDDVGNTGVFTAAEQEYKIRLRVEDTLDAMRTVSRHLALLPGRKRLLWITGGLPPNQLNGDADQRDQTIGAMNEGNVALYAVDARGLLTGNGANANIGTMEQLAGATGGKVYTNRNDIGAEVLEAVEDTRVSYILGFYLPESDRDGRFHELRVQVDRPGVELNYRRGYYAGADQNPDRPEKKTDLESVLLNPLDSTAVGITARLTLIDKPPLRKLRINLALDPKTTTLHPSGDEWTGNVDQLFVVTNDRGAVLAKFQNSVRFRVTPKTRARYDSGGMVYREVIDLPEGARDLQVIVRDTESGHVGTLRIPLGEMARSGGASHAQDAPR